MKKTFFLLVTLLLFTNIYTQQNRWEEYLQKRDYNNICNYNNNIYINTANILTEYTDTEINNYWKKDLLNHINISSLNSDNNYLYIGYNNGGVDILNNNITKSINDIINSNISTDKTINYICNKNDTLYICTNFGFITYSIKKQETIDTYLIGRNGGKIKVFDILFNKNKLYTATSEGLKSIDQNENYKIIENWNTIDNQETINIENNNDTIYYICKNSENKTVRILENNTIKEIDLFENNINNIKYIDNKLYIITDNKIYNTSDDVNMDSIVKYNQWTNNIYPSDITKYKGNIYITDHEYGLIKQINNDFFIKYRTGPFIDNTLKVNQLNNELWFTHSPSLGFNYNRSGASNYSEYNNNWYIYNSTTYYNQLDTIYDAIDVAFNKDENKAFIGYFTLGGVAEIKDNKFIKIHSNFNSTLKPTYWGAQTSVSSLSYDKDGNLYIMSNQSTEKPISVYATDSIWYNLPFTNEVKNNFFGDMIHTNSGDVWVTKPSGQGLLVFNDQKTFLNANDDNIKTYTNSPGEGNLISNKTTAIAEDKNGTIWVGTDKGLCIIDIYNTPYDNNNEAYEIIIDNNGVAEAVLGNQYITSIKIDGANRKWIGTANAGVFLLSDDGREELLHFTTENSPLLTDEISSIAINKENGKVYIASSLGTISYQSDASESKENYSEAKIFPNPFIRNKHDYITINNLTENSNIRITDISGNIIHQNNTNGGMYQWNCKNINNEDIKTGVYLIFISNEIGDTHTTLKLLVK